MDVRRLTSARGVGAAALAAVLVLAVCGCGDSGAAEPRAHGTKSATTQARAVRIAVDDLAENVGKAVLIRGTAVTARAGAAVRFADGTPVYIVGLAAWARTVEGKRIDVRGVLALRASRVQGGEEPSGGLGETYALDNARWTVRRRS